MSLLVTGHLALIGEGVEGDVGELGAHQFAPKNTADHRLNADDSPKLDLCDLEQIDSLVLARGGSGLGSSVCGRLVIVELKGLRAVPLDNLLDFLGRAAFANFLSHDSRLFLC